MYFIVSLEKKKEKILYILRFKYSYWKCFVLILVKWIVFKYLKMMHVTLLIVSNYDSIIFFFLHLAQNEISFTKNDETKQMTLLKAFLFAMKKKKEAKYECNQSILGYSLVHHLLLFCIVHSAHLQFSICISFVRYFCLVFCICFLALFGAEWENQI